MSIVAVRYAKTNLCKLIEKASRGEEVIIVCGSKSAARLLPIRSGIKRRPGSLRNQLRVGSEFFECLPLGEGSN